jgi:hypothetical protein
MNFFLDLGQHRKQRNALPHTQRLEFPVAPFVEVHAYGLATTKKKESINSLGTFICSNDSEKIIIQSHGTTSQWHYASVPQVTMGSKTENAHENTASRLFLSADMHALS